MKQAWTDLIWSTKAKSALKCKPHYLQADFFETDFGEIGPNGDSLQEEF